jgi:hypothetical protein
MMTIFQIISVVIIICTGSLLEGFERRNPNLFWGIIVIFLSFNTGSLIYRPDASKSDLEQTLFNIRSGSDSTKNIVIIQTSQGKRKKINIITHRRLEKFFPDWEDRISYQENREKVYKEAMIKRL